MLTNDLILILEALNSLPSTFGNSLACEKYLKEDCIFFEVWDDNCFLKVYLTSENFLIKDGNLKQIGEGKTYKEFSALLLDAIDQQSLEEEE